MDTVDHPFRVFAPIKIAHVEFEELAIRRAHLLPQLDDRVISEEPLLRRVVRRCREVIVYQLVSVGPSGNDAKEKYVTVLLLFFRELKLFSHLYQLINYQ